MPSIIISNTTSAIRANSPPRCSPCTQLEVSSPLPHARLQGKTWARPKLKINRCDDNGKCSITSSCAGDPALRRRTGARSTVPVRTRPSNVRVGHFGVEVSAARLLGNLTCSWHGQSDVQRCWEGPKLEIPYTTHVQLINTTTNRRKSMKIRMRSTFLQRHRWRRDAIMTC